MMQNYFVINRGEVYKMDMTFVSSSNIEAVGYDKNSETLRVSFIGGRLYDYHLVPEHLYQGLMNAASHGSYLDAYIKKGGYGYTELR